MRSLSCSRTPAILAILTLSLGAPLDLAGQNPPTIPSVTGGLSSRFIPLDVWSRMRERIEGPVEGVTLDAPVDSVWAALKTSLESLGVPIGFSDPANREMGNARAKLYRQLGKERVSTYLRCGEGFTGPNADTYVVYLSYVAFLRPAGDKAVTLLSLLTAEAVDLANGRNDPVVCTSTGRLEQRLAQQVEARVLPKR